jgi:hypothetical protein
MDRIATNKRSYATMIAILFFGIGVCSPGNTIAEGITSDQLSGEKNARRAADKNEKDARISSIKAERAARVAVDEALTNAIETDRNAYIQADTAEGGARAAADTAEGAARATADTAEANARAAADAAESGARVAADTAESNARSSADVALQNLIDANSLPPLPAGQFQVTLTRCGNSKTIQWEPCKYAIGDTGPAGGIVFYTADAGIHGLEAAPVDQGNAGWGCPGEPIAGALNKAVGAGTQNTAAILSACKEVGSAARIAHDYILNGYRSWFLPSVDELELMSTNIGIAASAPLKNVGKFEPQQYWSSSATDNNDAWVWNFVNNGNDLQEPKTEKKAVRAVRAF